LFDNQHGHTRLVHTWLRIFMPDSTCMIWWVCFFTTHIKRARVFQLSWLGYLTISCRYSCKTLIIFLL